MAKNSSTQVQIQGQQMLQTQSLSPLQVMVARMLQLTTVEMEERVRAEVLENPALEEGAEDPDIHEATDEEPFEGEGGGTESAEELALGDYGNEDDIPDYKLNGLARSTEQQAEEIPFSVNKSFYEVLLEQLREQPLDERQSAIAEYLIGSLESDGLLHKDLYTIGDELAIYQGMDCGNEELLAILQQIQQFDPAGIGARNLQECLLLQLDRKEPSSLLELEKRIVRDCYEEFTHKRWDKIALALSTDESEVTAAVAELVKLNPRPGSALGEAMGKNMQEIIPDFIVETFDDNLILSLNNGNVPELKVSRDFMQMLDEQAASKKSPQRDAAIFLKQKIDAAKDFISAIKQREKTLMDTMQAIIDFQRPFFLEGDESKLKPMILKDIAQRTHYDISTISRVSNSKYVQTNFGIFPLKYFFSDGVTSTDGEEVSIKEVHNLLKELVENEDKSHPLNDEQLVALLEEKGFKIARRTIAKYREQLHIPIARLRK